MKTGDIIAVRYYDITAVDNISDEDILKQDPKIMIVYGKLKDKTDSCIKVVVEEDETDGKEHHCYLILNHNIIGKVKILKSGEIKW